MNAVEIEAAVSELADQPFDPVEFPYEFLAAFGNKDTTLKRLRAGTVYVLRSLSNHPFVAEHRQLIHKIGVTGGQVEVRIAQAEKDATYLLAAVEIVATY
jgi:hypothetical protein